MRRRFLLAVPFCTLLLVSLAGGAEAPKPRFVVTDLGTLGGASSEANAVNEKGEVAGWSEAADRTHRAFLYRGGRMVDLGAGSGFKNSEALGINEAGQVVGFGTADRDIFTADTKQPLGSIRAFHALLWGGEKAREIGDGKARDINNRGVVVGHSYDGPGFRWEDGTSTRLYDPDRSLRAIAVNDAGEIVGEAAPRTGSTRIRYAFRWKEGRSEILEVGYTGGAQPGAFAINSRGDVAGVGGGFDGTAFLWSAGKITPLGTINGPAEVGVLGQHAGYHYSAALGLNDAGQVVGTGSVTDAGKNELRAFLWEAGRLTNLNALIDPASGWVLEDARALNNKGQICGVGLLNGKRRAFLASPSS